MIKDFSDMLFREIAPTKESYAWLIKAYCSIDALKVQNYDFMY